MKYTYPSRLCHVISEYMCLGWSVFKTLGVVACLFPATSEGRCPLEMTHAYPNTLCHVVSEYIWLGWSISKILGEKNEYVYFYEDLSPKP